MTDIYLTISLSTHNGDDTPQKGVFIRHWYSVALTDSTL